MTLLFGTFDPSKYLNRFIQYIICRKSNMDETYSLQWNGFHSHVNKFISRNQDYLKDVTIVTDDNHQIKTHKLILAASSEYFQNIFKNNASSNLMLCLEGVTKEDMNSCLDYMYNGEVEILNNDLQRFITIGCRFKLRGLVERELDEANEVEDVDTTSDPDPGNDENCKEEKNEIVVENSDRSTKGKEEINETVVEKSDQSTNRKEEINETVEEKSDQSTNLNEELWEKDSRSCIKKLGDGTFFCITCGYVSSGHVKRRLFNMKKHVETHITGLSYLCSVCELIFSSNDYYNKHKSDRH